MSQIQEGSEYSVSDEEESDYRSSSKKSNLDKILFKDKDLAFSSETDSLEIKQELRRRRQKETERKLKLEMDNNLRQVKKETYIQMNQNMKMRR